MLLTSEGLAQDDHLVTLLQCWVLHSVLTGLPRAPLTGLRVLSGEMQRHVLYLVTSVLVEPKDCLLAFG